MSTTIPGQAILAIVAVLMVVNVGTVLWLWLLHGRLRASGHDATAAKEDLDALKQEAHSVAFARILLQTEHAVGADIQTSVARLTAAFAEEMQGALSHIARHMESGVSQLLNRHLETLISLRETAIAQMEADAGQVLGQYRETLALVRDAAVKPLAEINDLADEQLASLSKHMRVESRRHEKHQGRLMAKFDRKLSDVVSLYLAEALGQDVDLGAQGPHLFRMLEEHKSELRQEIMDGA